jgi:SagB-type dehydrogenase family enzyme
MNTKRIRHDASYLVSALLLILATFTITTGWVSDLWDLNDFVFHTYAGYAMAVLSLVHVSMHWRQLVSYARWRLGQRPTRRRLSQPRVKNARPLHTDVVQQSTPPALSARALRTLSSRRGFVGLVLGSLGGFALGQGLDLQPDLPYGSDVGIIYHEWSKPRLLSLLGTVANWGRQPDQYKHYPSAETSILPSPTDYQGLYTEDAIRRRRSVRDFSGKVMTQEELSRLLNLTGGINSERWGYRLRAAPSAGALYPIEVYPVIHRVEGLQAGLYHYSVLDHALELLKIGDFRGEITRHGLMQGFLGQANLVLIFTASFQRLRWKYQERSYRYALLEAGHLGQNVYLSATSMAMGACAVGAFLDDDLNTMLGVDGQYEAAIYMLAVGKV